VDIQILRDLGYEVVPITRVRDIPRDVDLYYTWWWGGGFPTLLASLPRRRPNVFTGAHHYAQPHWDFDSTPFDLRSLLKRTVMRASLRLASANIFLSDDERGIVRHERVTKPYVVPLSVDIGFFTPDPGLARDRIVTISHLTSSNVRRKMIRELVEAFAVVSRERPAERLVIVGEYGDGYAAVRDLAQRLGIGDRVDFPGRVSREAKRDLLRRAKVYAQPSHHEGFGVAIAEAMACEAPALVTSVGSVPEVVGDAGVYVAERTPEAIAAGLLALLRRTDLSELGRRGRERVVEKFPYERRRDGIARVIAEL
jgi:glycosyltransferase involved in cell wall biosynthesis